jgi:hypothetical protein
MGCSRIEMPASASFACPIGCPRWLREPLLNADRAGVRIEESRCSRTLLVRETTLEFGYREQKAVFYFSTDSWGGRIFAFQ